MTFGISKFAVATTFRRLYIACSFGNGVGISLPSHVLSLLPSGYPLNDQPVNTAVTPRTLNVGSRSVIGDAVFHAKIAGLPVLAKPSSNRLSYEIACTEDALTSVL